MTVPTTTIGGVAVSRLALGSWHIFDRLDFHDAVGLVRHAVDAGITAFDIGVYSTPEHLSYTDVIFGAVRRAAGLEPERMQATIKLWAEGFGDDGFRSQLRRALERVGLERADRVVLGDLFTRIDLEAAAESLAELVREGLIGTWGLNQWSIDDVTTIGDAAERHGLSRPTFAQMKYSSARRTLVEGPGYTRLFADGFLLEASDVLEGGILAGTPGTDRQIGKDPGNVREAIVRGVPELRKVAERHGVSLATLGVAFALSFPSTATVLLGARRTSHVDDAIAAFDFLERVGAERLREELEPFWHDRGAVDPQGTR